MKIKITLGKVYQAHYTYYPANSEPVFIFGTDVYEVDDEPCVRGHIASGIFNLVAEGVEDEGAAKNAAPETVNNTAEAKVNPKQTATQKTQPKAGKQEPSSTIDIDEF